MYTKMRKFKAAALLAAGLSVVAPATQAEDMEYEQGKMEGSQNGLLFLEIENLLARMNADTRSTQKSLTLLIHSVFST